MLYRQKSGESLNTMQAVLFTLKTAGKRHLPPKLSRLHCARAHYQVVLWESAGMPAPPPLDPQEFGWEKKGNLLQPVYMLEGQTFVPDEVLHLTSC